VKPSNFLELTKILKTTTTIFGTKLVTIGFIIEFNVSVAVTDKILLSFELDSQGKIPIFLRYKLLHAEKINRRPEGGGHRSMSTP